MDMAGDEALRVGNMELVRAFARSSDLLLPRLYSPEALSNPEVLPEEHYAGALVSKAVTAMDCGELLTAVRSLRRGLGHCPELGGLFGFLMAEAERRIPPETACETARRLAQTGDAEGALRQYAGVLEADSEPEELLEAAAYLLENGEDSSAAYVALVQLYNAGYYPETILPLLTRLFYEPGLPERKLRYERNCRRLAKYPYLFRKDFPAFEELPLYFYPFDGKGGYFPFSLADGCFLGFFDVKEERVTHHFFQDLEKPVLAEDIFSQYELEYLRDNVRPSEYVAKENHIYLHYSSWMEFCAWLQVLDFGHLLEGKKFVFLMEEERSLYPLDFKERFGIDYSTFPFRPVGIREIHRLIWHVLLSTHNGGDFFNEIFDSHPNLLAVTSFIMDEIEEEVGRMKEALAFAKSPEHAQTIFPDLPPHIVRELYRIRKPSGKEWLILWFMMRPQWAKELDPRSRIAPALMFQPHFPYLFVNMKQEDAHTLSIGTREEELLRNSDFFRDFRYLKAFIPMRRFTTSYGGTMRFMWAHQSDTHEWKGREIRANIIPDTILDKIGSRTFMAAEDNRLMKDAVVVGFENGKLNPKATFTALSAFLDIPYTESMTYCSFQGEKDPNYGISAATYAAGFNTSSVYKTYDEYATDEERCFLEYFMRDAYEFYGYDFHYYDGKPMTRQRLEELLRHFDKLDHFIEESWMQVHRETTEVERDGKDIPAEEKEPLFRRLAEEQVRRMREHRRSLALLLLENPKMVSASGLPLHMIPKLELDPDLLETELYH